jgi:putative glutamine amidotransferase
LPTGKPILGICYGCQFINVLSGGKLVQHLTDHRVEPKGPLPHALNLNPESMVAQACGGAQFEADSSHHQAIETLGEGLRVAGHAMDGTIEAIESANGRWLLGVQWHPERTPESPHTQALLRAFVEEAARSRK